MVPFKTCTYNCVYCECGKTTNLTADRAEYIPAKHLINEIDSFLATAQTIDVITFAGSGEPTLNTALNDVIKHIKSRYPEYKTAILTNGSLLYLKEVRQSIMPVDYVLPSLDTISQSTFKKINSPAKSLFNNEIIEGLTVFSKEYKGTLWIEVFVVPGLNDTENELTLLKEILEKINPDRVQLNTLDRPGAYSWVEPVTSKRMQEIADFFLPLPVEIIARKITFSDLTSYSEQSIKSILQTLKRRPMTVEDLSVSFSNSINKTRIILDNLMQTNLISSEKVAGKFFYRVL
jgi:wyosine [tRNA(Phe)-imidazoG37] synthetase (radical SAM superfamily)